MPDYLLLIRGCMTSTLSPDQMQDHLQKARTWIDKLTKDGIFKGGQPLADGGKWIRDSKQKPIVTDGPYAESKDLVNGYIIIQASSLAKATEIAKKAPMLHLDGSVEIREIKDLHNM